MKLFVEIPTEMIGDEILASTFRPATEEDRINCQNSWRNGECIHSVFYDEPGFIYDFRKCGVCHELIDMI